MKSSIKKLLVLLVVVASFVATQAVWAGRPVDSAAFSTVAGTITAVDEGARTIEVNDGTSSTTIYCIPFNYLLNQYNIYLDTSDSVSVYVYEATLDDTTVQNIAVSLTVSPGTVEETTVDLRAPTTLKPIR
jgi:hypothetical protein